MKNKKVIIASTAIVACTTTLSFASGIKTIEKNKEKYIPLEEIIKKAGGSITKDKGTINIKINGKSIEMKSDSSFVKINDKYQPLKTTEVDGVIVPKDEKVITEKEKIYINKDFLKGQRIIDYKIENNYVVLNSTTKQPTRPVVEVEEEDREEITDRPGNNSGNNNNNASNNNSNNNNSGNRPNPPRPEPESPRPIPPRPIPPRPEPEPPRPIPPTPEPEPPRPIPPTPEPEPPTPEPEPPTTPEQPDGGNGDIDTFIDK